MLLLRPRDGVIDPAPVSAGSYFSPQQIERAEDFRDGAARALRRRARDRGRRCSSLLVRRPPQWLRGRSGRPVLAAAAAGAALRGGARARRRCRCSAVAPRRAIDVGLVTQSWGGLGLGRRQGLGDRGGSSRGGGAAAVVALCAGSGGAGGSPARPGSAWLRGGVHDLGPVVLDPIFNKFTPVREGRRPGRTC